MLLIRELWRVATDVARFSVTGGRVMLLVAVIVAAVVAATTATVTIVGPVVVYPFL